MLRNEFLKWTGFYLAIIAMFYLLTPIGSGLAQEKIKVDPKIPSYKKVSGISGNLNSIGSDTMNNLMTL